MAKRYSPDRMDEGSDYVPHKKNVPLNPSGEESMSRDWRTEEAGMRSMNERAGISGRMIRRVGSHPGVANVSGGEQSSSPSEIPRVRDDD